MGKKKAKLIFKHNSFDIVEDGDYVLCAISGKEILLKDLSYWNVDLQEAYYSPVSVPITDSISEGLITLSMLFLHIKISVFVS